VRIQRARECLQLFIRSLPAGSLFEIVRFGSSFERLFGAPAPYDESHVCTAMLLAGNMQANLGGTSLLKPLTAIFTAAPAGAGQRQVFILTEGKVGNAPDILAAAHTHARENRIFTLGIGADADAGIVEGLARETGGRSEFVGGSDNIADRLIPQLECALEAALANVAVEVSGVEGVEFAPFPIPALSRGVAATLYASARTGLAELGAVFVSGDCAGTAVEFTVPGRAAVLPPDALAALFAYTAIEALELDIRAGRRAAEAKAALVRLSVAHRILCSQTAFVGVSERIYRRAPEVHGMSHHHNKCKKRCLPTSFRLAKSSTLSTPAYFAKCELGPAEEAGPSAAPAPAPAPQPRAETASDRLMHIVGLQNIDGSWSDVDAVVALSGVSAAAFSTVRADSEAVFATALAVAVLRRKCADRQSAWRLVERKAVAWLSVKLGGLEAAEVLITRVVAVL
jgi:hypothetical protein